MTYPVTEVFCWVVDDPTEKHKLIGYRPPHMPLMVQCAASERHRAEKIRDEIKLMAPDIGLPISLKRFVLAETLETITP